MATGIEMASAYVSLQVDGSNLDQQARRSGQKAGEAYADGFEGATKKGPTPDPGKGSEKKSRESGRKAGDAYAGALDRQVRTQVKRALEALPDIKVDADTSAATRQIQNMRKSLERLSDKKIGVDIDAVTALNRIEGIQGRLTKLGAESPDIGVRVDSGAASAALDRIRASAGLLDDKTVEIDVDVNSAGAVAKLNTLNASMRSTSTGMSGLWGTALALSPALVPLGAAAIGAAAGLGALGAAAGAGAGVLALAIGPVNEAVKALDAAEAAGGRSAAANRKAAEAMAGLTPAARETVTLMRGPLRAALDSMQKTAGAAFLPGFNTFLRAAPGAMKQLAPLVTDLGTRLGRMAVSASRALQGPFWARFVAFMSSKLGPWMDTAGRIVANLGKGLAGLFMRLSPLADQFGGTIERLTARFAAWATNPGSGSFEKFLTYAKQSLPLVISFLGAFALAFGNVTAALAPLGPVVLSLLTTFARFVAGMDPAHVRMYAIALGVLFGIYKLAKVSIATAAVATNAYALAIRLKTIATRSDVAAENAGIIAKGRAAVSTVAATVAERARTIATKAGTAAQWLMNAAMRANPIGIVITTLVALGAVFVLLWKRNQTFRKVVLAVWSAVKVAMAATVSWFRNTAWPVMRTVFGWIGARASWLYNNVIRPVFGWIKTAIGAVFSWLRDSAWPIFRNVFGWLARRAQWLYNNVIKPVFGWIKAIIGAVVAWLRDTVWPIYSRVFGWIGTGAKNLYNYGIKPAFNWISSKIGAVASWFRDKVWPIFRGALGNISRAFTAAKDGIGKAWGKIRDLAKKPVEFVVNTVFGGLLNAIRKIPGMSAVVDPIKKGMGIPIKLATGGRVPGWSPNDVADNIPAMLTADEEIIKRKSARRMRREFPGHMEHINRFGAPPMMYARGGRVGRYVGATGYASGGRAGMDNARSVRNRHTWPLIWNYVKSKFSGIRMTSNYRPGARSAAGPVSSHALGTAIDIVGSIPNVSRVMTHMRNHYGKNMRDLIYSPLWGSRMIYNGRDIKAPAVTQRMHYDHGHIGLMPGKGLGGGPVFGTMYGSATASGFDPMGWVRDKIGGVLGGIGDPAKWLANKVKGVAKNKFGNSLPAQAAIKLASRGFSKIGSWVTDKVLGGAPAADSGPAGAGVQRWAGMVKQALGLVNQPESLVQTVLRRMQQESGGNPRAINNWDSNARRGTPSKGLMQVIDPTFRRYFYPGYGTNIWDPLSNILASMRYAMARYGSLSRAYNKRGGYANGTPSASRGLHLVGERGVELVDFRGGERVYNNSETKQILQGGAPHITINVTGVSGEPREVAAAVAREFSFEMGRIGRHVGRR